MTILARRRFVALLLSLLLLLPAACSAGSKGQAAADTLPSIALSELPEGPGRGFPTVVTTAKTPAAAPAIGEAAPDFRIAREDGASLSLSSLRGRPVIINHWATWCGPCRQEMPELVQAAAAHEELVIIGANLMEARSAMEPFVAEYSIPFPVTVDPEGVIAGLYGVRGLPTTIFIDREGKVSAIVPGLLTEERLATLLADIL